MGDSPDVPAVVPAKAPAKAKEKVPPKEAKAPATTKEGEDENDDWCLCCQDGGNLVCCDSCRNAFHQKCLKKRWGKASLPPADEDAVWKCPPCCGHAKEDKPPPVKPPTDKAKKKTEAKPAAAADAGGGGKAAVKPYKSARKSTLGQSAAKKPPAKKKAETETPAEEDANEDWCFCCQDGGDLVCCDTCRNAFHEDCLKNKWGEAALPPADEDVVWKCPGCSGGAHTHTTHTTQTSCAFERC